MTWYTHEVALRTLRLSLKMKAESPLRVGAGRSVAKMTLVDLPVLVIRKDGSDVPYIPGSTLKGVFRSSSEFVAKSSGVEVCMMGEGCKERYDRELQENIKSGRIDGVRKTLSKYCLACKIFGSATFRSHIYFSDAYPDSTPSRSVKSGIAIDRKSGAVKGGALYFVEFINPGATFHGDITFINIPNYGIGLIAEVIDLINRGFVRVGGFKSRGFGKLSVEPVSLDGFVLSNGKMLGISELSELPAVDELDEKISLSGLSNLESLLEGFREVWRRYAERTRGKG